MGPELTAQRRPRGITADQRRSQRRDDRLCCCGCCEVASLGYGATLSPAGPGRLTGLVFRNQNGNRARNPVHAHLPGSATIGWEQSQQNRIFYSITSSASASNVGGTSRPSALRSGG